MSDKEINALETRFKSTVLLLMNLELLCGKLEQYVEYSQRAFDMGNYPLSKKCLDLLDFEIVELLEL